MTTLAEALAAATQRLRSDDVETPQLDARILLEWSCGLNAAQQISRADMQLGCDALSRFEKAIEQRSTGRPVARIIGEKEFWGLGFSLNSETLVPRPDTETVVEAVLTSIDEPHQNWPGSICDLGAGSGAILISLLSELPKATGTGVDISAKAVACARQNADRHGLRERINWIVGDYGTVPDKRFDIVVCNPPYIAGSSIAGLPREVRDHDPRRALDGGIDGLQAYGVLAARLPDLLTQNGLAALEIGEGQSDSVTTLMIHGGLAVERTVPDLARIPRVLVCRLP